MNSLLHLKMLVWIDYLKQTSNHLALYTRTELFNNNVLYIAFLHLSISRVMKTVMHTWPEHCKESLS